MSSRIGLFAATALVVALAPSLLSPARVAASGGPDKTGKKGQKKAQKAPPPIATSAPVVDPPKGPASTDPVPPAENDPQRTAWRLGISPYSTLGSGHPGKAAADFDKPDGVAFTPSGLLLATDAKNRRVQVWDVKTGQHLGEFGHKFFGGEIVDIAVAPSGLVLVTDQTLNLAYAFVPPAAGAVDKDSGKPLGPLDYQFKGTRFGEQGFDKLGGIAVDSKNRVYCVDAHLNEVRRFKPDCTPDQTWRFEKARAGGDTYLHGCEGIAIDEATKNLYVSSEKDSVVQVFDSETGAYKRQLLGAGADPTGTPSGKHVFFASVEGLAIARNHLFAVDEAAGHIQLFDLARPTVFNADLDRFSVPRRNAKLGYLGFFGHAPLVDFEDKTNADLQRRVKDESIIPGQANPPGYFCSPDSIAAYTDPASGETYIAIADQCNYRLAVYRWSDLAAVLGKGGAVADGDRPSPDVAKGGKKGGKKGKKPH